MSRVITIPPNWQITTPILAHHANVSMAWLFGSAQRGAMSPESDIDIAVLFETAPTFDELLDLRTDLQLALPFAEIDLVTLNQANPILRFEAVCGSLLFCRSHAHRAEFVSLTAREYENEMAMVNYYLSLRKS